MNQITTIPKQSISDKIYTIRGVQVMLDRDLAELYGVETKHINQAQGGINISLDSKDSISSHIEDTYKSSHNLANIDMIKILCEEAKESLEWIDSMGVVFSKDENGEFEQRRLGGSSHKRACYASDYTGLKIVQTMFDYALKLGVEFKEEMMLLNLIVEGDICYGATFLDIKTILVEQILANSTIIATGGYSAIYEGFTTNSYSVTGDGIAAAFRAGCRLSNMEFVQFHPTALEENALLLSESARAEGGYLVDSDGKRFVDELQSRDIVSRAVFEKLKTSKVFLDIRHLGASFIKEKLPQEISIASLCFL
jgi:aspartate oxidase